MSMNSESVLNCDRLWQGARLATMTEAGVVEDGVVACRDGRIVYAGSRADAPALQAREVVDCAGRWITPGLIDCHTHLIHAGNRAHEFELRLAGASYEEIARAGGGIVSTMKATRAASRLVLTLTPRTSPRCRAARSIFTSASSERP
jgi:imidazolonepropionase